MTGLPIKEISERAGYAELTAFHRAFRKATGLTSWDPIGVTLTLNDAP